MLNLQISSINKTLSEYSDKEETLKPGDWFNTEIYKINNFDNYSKRLKPTYILLIINIWNDYIEMNKSYVAGEIIKIIKKQIEILSSFIVKELYIIKILNVISDYYVIEHKDNQFNRHIIRKTQNIQGKYKLADFKNEQQ